MTTSPFIELPAELRNRIYEFAVIESDPIDLIVCCCKHCPHMAIVVQPAVTRASRQLREESLPIFYGQNLFLGQAYEGYVPAKMIRWLRAIGAQNRSHIKNLYVDFGEDLELLPVVIIAVGVVGVRVRLPEDEVCRVICGRAAESGARKGKILHLTFA